MCILDGHLDKGVGESKLNRALKIGLSVGDVANNCRAQWLSPLL